MSNTPQPVEEIVRPISRPKQDKGRKDIEKKFHKLQALKVEYVSIESIYPNAYNPNRQSDREFELLLKSMEEDGFTTPIVVQRKTKQIVDGEHRWRAATRLGYKEIPVAFVDMTPEQMRIATLRHNRARGSEDVELSIKILQDLRELGALDKAVDSLQISDRELRVLIDDLPAPEQMANEEFSNAWLPSDIAAEPDHQQFENKEVHVSPKVKEMKKELEITLEKADSLMSMGEINKRASKQFVTMTFVLEGNKASFVKRVLGATPAETLLKMTFIKMIETPELLERIFPYADWIPTFINECKQSLGSIPEDVEKLLLEKIACNPSPKKFS